jgi:CRISPR-associated protein Csm2
MKQTLDIPRYDDQGNKQGKATLNPRWVLSDEGLPLEAVQFAEDFGRHLSAPFWNKGRKRLMAGRDAMTTTQLRNFFSEIRRIQANEKNLGSSWTDIYLLKPKLAYASARVESQYNRIHDFARILGAMLDEVSQGKQPQYFVNFAKFVQAVVAYHKFYGGK